MFTQRHLKFVLFVNLGLIVFFLPVFIFVAISLDTIAKITQIDYELVNVFVYYVLIPLSWVGLLIYGGKKQSNKVVTVVGYLILLSCFGLIGLYTGFSRVDVHSLMMNIWDYSILFLDSFGHKDVSYLFMSVIICVNAVLIIYHGLLLFASNRYYKYITGKDRYGNTQHEIAWTTTSIYQK